MPLALCEVAIYGIRQVMPPSPPSPPWTPTPPWNPTPPWSPAPPYWPSNSGPPEPPPPEFPTTFPQFPPHGEANLPSYEMSLSSPSFTELLCALQSYVTAVKVDDASGTEPYVTGFLLESCSGIAFASLAGIEPYGSWTVEDACTDGYSAVRAYEDPAEGPYGMWGLQLYCQGSGGYWTAPVGFGPAGVSGVLRELNCPRGWILSGFNSVEDGGYVLGMMPACSPNTGVSYDPMGTCPPVEGGGVTLLPGYAPPNPSYSNLGVETTLAAALAACEADADCNAVISNPQNSGASGDDLDFVLQVGGSWVWRACGGVASVYGRRACQHPVRSLAPTLSLHTFVVATNWCRHTGVSILPDMKRQTIRARYEGHIFCPCCYIQCADTPNLLLCRSTHRCLQQVDIGLVYAPPDLDGTAGCWGTYMPNAKGTYSHGRSVEWQHLDPGLASSLGRAPDTAELFQVQVFLLVACRCADYVCCRNR